MHVRRLLSKKAVSVFSRNGRLQGRAEDKPKKEGLKPYGYANIYNAPIA
jgi:hypothetical protein